MQQTVFIGAGAGFAGDRTDAAGPVAEALARSDGPRFLIFETLAERTLALAQVERRRDPARGYNPLLEAFVGPVLRTCLENKIRIVSNFGAANPQGAAMRICEMGRAAGFPGILVAVVEGDDLTGALSPQEFAARETGGALLADGPAIVAANVYLGAAPIAEASAAAPTSSSPAASPIRRWRSGRSSTPSAGRRTTGTGSPPARSSATSSNAGRR